MDSKLKITVKTPKGQARKCMLRQKEQLVGFKKVKDIIEEKEIDDKTFYYIIAIEDEQEMMDITKRLALGENMIKDFYKKLYKMINTVNKFINHAYKFGKLGMKAIPYVLKKTKKYLLKIIPDKNQRKDLEENLEENIKEGKFKDNVLQPITIDDKKDMDKLLAGKLIDVERLDV